MGSPFHKVGFTPSNELVRMDTMTVIQFVRAVHCKRKTLNCPEKSKKYILAYKHYKHYRIWGQRSDIGNCNLEYVNYRTEIVIIF